MKRNKPRPWTNVGSFSLREVLSSDSQLIAQYIALAELLLLKYRSPQPMAGARPPAPRAASQPAGPQQR